MIFVSSLFFAIPVLASECGACSVDSGSSGSGSSGSSVDSAIILMDKAKSEAKLGHANASLLLYENATNADQYYTQAWVAYSDALNSTGNITGSISAIGRAIELSPGDADLLVKRGDLFASLGNITLAGEAYKKAESMNPNIAGIQDKIGNLSVNSVTTSVPEVFPANATTEATTSPPQIETPKSTQIQIPTTTKSPLSIYSIVISIVAGFGIAAYVKRRE